MNLAASLHHGIVKGTEPKSESGSEGGMCRYLPVGQYTCVVLLYGSTKVLGYNNISTHMHLSYFL